MIYFFLCLFMAGIVAADQLVKAAIVSRYAPYVEYWLANGIAPAVPRAEWGALVPGIVHLTFQPNTGAAFSFLSGRTWIFLVITALFFVLVGIALWKKWLKTKPELWAMAAICGGALGNLIDRLVNGYVVDMFEVEFMDFAVFNVADCFITCGAIALVLSVLLEGKRK